LKNTKSIQDEMKNEFFKNFFEIGGNYKKVDKARALKKKIDKHLENLGTCDLQLLDLSRILKIYTEEMLYGDDFERLSEMASPIADRLIYTNIVDWIIDNIKLSQAVILYIGNHEKADKLAKKTLVALKKHIQNKPVYMIEFFLYLNILSCFLQMTFFKVDITQDSEVFKSLKKLFKSYSNKALKIYDENKEELKAYELMLLIRIALFDRDSESAVEALEKLKDIDKPLYASMKKEVIKYSPHFGSEITQKQRRMLIGENIKTIRERFGLSREEFEKKLNFEEGYICFIERGERNAPVHKLLKICEVFDISTDELFYGTIFFDISRYRYDEAIYNKCFIFYGD